MNNTNAKTDPNLPKELGQTEINLQYTTIKGQLPDFIYDGLRDYAANANGYKPQPEELITLIAKLGNLL